MLPLFLLSVQFIIFLNWRNEKKKNSTDDLSFYFWFPPYKIYEICVRMYINNTVYSYPGSFGTKKQTK